MRENNVRFAALIIGIIVTAVGFMIGVHGVEHFDVTVVIGFGVMLIGMILVGFGFSFDKEEWA